MDISFTIKGIILVALILIVLLDIYIKKRGELSIFQNFRHINTEVNGEIDEPFFQGNKGDCVLLAIIYSLSCNEKGREILKNSICINNNESYTVNFKGIKRSYIITKEELKQKSKEGYSSGDPDVLLLEIAFEKYQIDSNRKKRISKLSIKKNLNRIDYNSVFMVLAGKNGRRIDVKNFIKNIENNKYGNNLAVTCGKNGNNLDFDNILDLKNVYQDFHYNHAYSVKEIKNNRVIIVNPWYSDDEIIVSKEEFIKLNPTIQFLDLDK